METMAFGYHLLMRPDDPTGQPVNVIAVARSTGPTQAVLWDRRTSTWNFRPDAAVALLYADWEERHTTEAVDRATAERATAHFTDVPLPSEEELTQICRAAGPNWRRTRPA